MATDSSNVSATAAFAIELQTGPQGTFTRTQGAPTSFTSFINTVDLVYVSIGLSAISLVLAVIALVRKKKID